MSIAPYVIRYGSTGADRNSDAVRHYKITVSKAARRILAGLYVLSLDFLAVQTQTVDRHPVKSISVVGS